MHDNEIAKSRPSTLIDNGLVYLLAPLAPILAGLIVMPILTRELGPRDFGQLAQYLAFANYSLLALTAGIPAGLLIVGSRKKNKPSVINLALRFGMFLSILLASLFTVFIWFVGSPPQYFLAIYIASFGAGNAMVQAVLISRNRRIAYVGSAFAISFIAPLIGLLAIEFVTRSPVTYLCGYGAGILSLWIIGLAVTARGSRNRNESSIFIEVVRTGLTYFPGQLAVGSILSVLIFLAGLVISTEAAGQVQLAFLIGTSGLVAINALSSGWTTKVQQTELPDRARQIQSNALSLSLLALAAEILIGASSPFVIPIIAPVSVFPLATIYPALVAASASAIFAVGYLANVQHIYGENFRLDLSWATLLAVLLSVLLAVPLCAFFGVTGTGVAFSLAYLFLLITSRIVARKRGIALWKTKGYYWLATGSVVFALTIVYVPSDSPWWVAARLVLSLAAGIWGIQLLRSGRQCVSLKQ